MEKTIVELEFKGKPIITLDVVKVTDGDTTRYHVVVDGEDRHGPCTADDALRAMATYTFMLGCES